ncbi:hypothetical protein KC207_13320 [Phycicoccus sp. BSK3Z-2]|uniref:DUF2029 domain-containing protein n=1 Tax=Phycicoccus avicenniae TaxID=2828860 RepID=A0A941D8X0_9MICO|nr:hypothetical protein [Phycicoccus avicenniae]MBR7744269.1 hypothetical protein [Phycicoccus avicenniae]
MAQGLTTADTTADGPTRRRRPRPEVARRVTLTVSLLLLLLVGLSRPNAAQPDLLPRGWAPGPVLPVSLDPAVLTALLWAAYALAAVTLLLATRTLPGPLRGWRVPGLLGAVTLLAAPFGSADHVNYLAYGRILVTGGDPWLVSPVEWGGGADPVTSRVEEPWTEEPSVYGPAGTAVFGVAARLGGENLREGVWVWQLVLVLAWLAVRAALRATLPADRHGRVDVFWTLNPFVVGVGVLGAHVDVLAAAFVLAAVLAAARLPGTPGALLAGALVALAGSTKVTYAVAAVALAVGWWVVGGPMAALRRSAVLVLGALVIAGPLHLWAGEHVYDQLDRSRQAVSLATPWRLLLDAVDTVGPFGVRDVIGVGAAVLAVVLALALTRATAPDPGTPTASVARSADLPPAATRSSAGPDAFAPLVLRVLVVLHLAYSLAASYSLPWYDAVVWAALPALAASAVDVLAVLRGLVAALAYVPGRVLGMTPGVEEVTLGFRADVAPFLVAALWVLAVRLGVRGGRAGSRSRPAPRGAPPPG